MNSKRNSFSHIKLSSLINGDMELTWRLEKFGKNSNTNNWDGDHHWILKSSCPHLVW